MEEQMKTRLDTLLKGLRSLVQASATNPDLALQIAVQLRVLLHNTRSSHALINILDLRANINLESGLNTVSDENTRIVEMVSDAKWAFIEPFDPCLILDSGNGRIVLQPTRAMTVEEWWTQPVYLYKQCVFIPDLTRVTEEELQSLEQSRPVLKESIQGIDSLAFTRKQIVCSAANKLGGAHIDPNPAEKDLLLETGCWGDGRKTLNHLLIYFALEILASDELTSKVN